VFLHTLNELHICENSFTAVWNRLITIIARDDPLLPPVIFSAFAFARGIGSILSGPISVALLKYGRLEHAKLGYGVENYVRWQRITFSCVSEIDR